MPKAHGRRKSFLPLTFEHKLHSRVRSLTLLHHTFISIFNGIQLSLAASMPLLELLRETRDMALQLVTCTRNLRHVELLFRHRILRGPQISLHYTGLIFELRDTVREARQVYVEALALAQFYEAAVVQFAAV